MSEVLKGIQACMPITEPEKAEVKSARKFTRRNLWIALALIATVIVAVVGAAWIFLPLFPLRERAMFLWMQPAVSGQDNWGTATYKDGILYAPSKAYDMVYAINASNGEIIWNKPVRYCSTSPSIDGDVIYVGETDPRDYKPRAMALNRTTGEEIWNFVDIEPDDYAWMHALVYGDYVYYTTWGSVYALNKTNGNPIWHENSIKDVICSVAYHDGVVFVSALDPPGQYAFNATTGEIVWHANFGGSWDSSPVIYDGMIIQACRPVTEGYTCVLNETTGELIRKFSVGTLSTPLVHDGKIFIPSMRWMWAFDLMTGEKLWRTVELHDGTYQDRSYCSPAGAGGAIYYQSLNGTFYVIDEADGSILWSYALEGLGFGSPSIGDGCVFITNDAGLYAFKIGPGLGSGDWPTYCQNNLHISYSEHGIEHVGEPAPPPPSWKLYATIVVVTIVAIGIATITYRRKHSA